MVRTPVPRSARLVSPRIARRTALLLSLVATATLPASARAQGHIDGVVRDTAGAGIAGAELRIVGSPYAAQSDEGGSFHIGALPAGTVEIQLRRIGFAPATVRVPVATTAAAPPVTIIIHEIARELPSVVVRADRTHRYTGYLAGFYERRDRGFGHFVTAADIQQRHPMETTDLLRAFPGVMIAHDTRGFTHVRLRGNSCAPAVWVDGFPAVAAEFNVDDIAPSDLAGIEVYSGAAEVPVQYVVPFGPTACGTIMFWTHHPEPPQRGPRVTAAQLDSLVATLRVYTADQVDTPARVDSAAPVIPAYPDSLYRARVAGHVLAEFVVDSTGRARPATIGVVSSSDPLFTRSVRTAIEGARFIPARRNGAMVPQVVRQSFDFVVPADLKPDSRGR